jgi:hypothetical protein
VPPAQVSSTNIPSHPGTIPTETKEISPKHDPSTPIIAQPEVIPLEKKEMPPAQVSSKPTSAQPETIAAEVELVPLARTSSTYVPLQQETKTVETKAASPAQPSSIQEENEEPPINTEHEAYEEVLIGKQKVKISIPDNIIRQAKLANSESKNKLAGYWSAQIIKENPHVMHSPNIDPVSIWFEIKSVILNKFNGTSNTN